MEEGVSPGKGGENEDRHGNEVHEETARHLQNTVVCYLRQAVIIFKYFTPVG